MQVNILDNNQLLKDLLKEPSCDLMLIDTPNERALGVLCNCLGAVGKGKRLTKVKSLLINLRTGQTIELPYYAMGIPEFPVRLTQSLGLRTLGIEIEYSYFNIFTGAGAADDDNVSYDSIKQDYRARMDLIKDIIHERIAS